MDENEMKAQQEAIRKWALKKMQKQEKKLRKFARIYFGNPVGIIYFKNDAKIVHADGTESTITVPED